MQLRQFIIALTSLTLLSLTACGDGSSEAGIRVNAQTTYMTSDTPSGDPDAVTDPAQQDSARKAIYRDDNMYIQLQLGLVNLRAGKLIPCESVIAKAMAGLLNFIAPAAYAHSAHIPSGPAGVIDVLKPDLLVWDLGQQAAQKGRYCGIRFGLLKAPGQSGDHHTAESNAEEAEEESGFDMAGKSVVVAPCYYAETAGTTRTELDGETPHKCIEVTLHGDASGEVLFAEPLVLNENRRDANLMLATHYDRWFDGLDMTILADDHDEQAKMAGNIVDSFYLYSVE